MSHRVERHKVPSVVLREGALTLVVLEANLSHLPEAARALDSLSV
jgi:hypothetical protein